MITFVNAGAQTAATSHPIIKLFSVNIMRMAIQNTVFIPPFLEKKTPGAVLLHRDTHYVYSGNKIYTWFV